MTVCAKCGKLLTSREKIEYNGQYYCPACYHELMERLERERYTAW